MVDQFHIGDFRNFVYLITFDGESLVVDPQSELDQWESRIAKLGSKLTGVLLTHTHWDHVAGLPAIAAKYGTSLPVYLQSQDARRLLKAAPESLRFVEDGELIAVGNEKIEVLHTPGHSPGECCYLIRTKPAWQLFTGDTVFVGNVGRTDLEGGSTAELFHTIQRLKRLPAETIIYPGHHYGLTPTSTIGHESAHSDAFRCRTIEELDALP